MSETPLREISGQPTPRTGALRATGALGMALALALAALPLSPSARLLGFGIFLGIGWIVQARITADHPGARFGLGNIVTLTRAAGVALLAALATTPRLLDGGLAWLALGISAAVLILDGIDGWAARHQRLDSRFGARFDMEVDALAILVLAALALGLGKAGPWVLGLGLMRYAFVLAGWLRPALARPLPPSLRRKAICVLQIAVLTLLLIPAIEPPLSQFLALIAFAALTFSFAADLRWLIRSDQ